MRPTEPSRRLLAFAAVQTALVATFAGVAAGVLRYTPLGFSLYTLDPGASGPAAVATVAVVRAVVAVVAALYVLVPVAVGWYMATRGERHWLAPTAWAAVAVLGLPWLWYLVLEALTTVWTPGTVVLASAPAPVMLALVVARRRTDATDRDSTSARDPADAPAGGSTDTSAHGSANALVRPSPATFLNLAVVALFVAGAALGAGVLAGPTAGLVEDVDLGASTTAWDFEYEPTGDDRGVLTVTHDGGDKAAVDHLYVRGDGFADVAGAKQTGPGPWTGETTGDTVVAGDSTTVGVTSDCEIRLVYQNTAAVQTIGYHECGRAGEGALGGQPRDGGGP